MRDKVEFELFTYPKRMLAIVQEQMTYNVYEDATHYVVVVANTAMEAVECSGISAPEKIVRNGIGRQHIIDMKLLSEDDVSAQMVEKPSLEDAIEPVAEEEEVKQESEGNPEEISADGHAETQEEAGGDAEVT